MRERPAGTEAVDSRRTKAELLGHLAHRQKPVASAPKTLQARGGLQPQIPAFQLQTSMQAEYCWSPEGVPSR